MPRITISSIAFEHAILSRDSLVTAKLFATVGGIEMEIPLPRREVIAVHEQLQQIAAKAVGAVHEQLQATDNKLITSEQEPANHA